MARIERKELSTRMNRDVAKHYIALAQRDMKLHALDQQHSNVVDTDTPQVKRDAKISWFFLLPVTKS